MARQTERSHSRAIHARIFSILRVDQDRFVSVGRETRTYGSNGEGSPSGIGHERRSIFLEREAADVRTCGYEKFRAAGNEVRSQKSRVHVWTATVICSRIHGHLSAHGPACLLLHRQNSIVPD